MKEFGFRLTNYILPSLRSHFSSLEVVFVLGGLLELLTVSNEKTSEGTGDQLLLFLSVAAQLQSSPPEKTSADICFMMYLVLLCAMH